MFEKINKSPYTIVILNFLVFISFITVMVRIIYTKLFANNTFYILLNEKSYLNLLTNNTVSITRDNLISKQSIFEDILHSSIFDYLIVIMIFLVFMILISIYSVHKIKTIKRDITNEIVKEVLTIKFLKDTELNKDISISEIKEKIDELFFSHFNDYKKINSYISHEQKNILAVLKSEAEIIKDERLMKTVVALTNSADELLTLSDTSKGNEEVTDLSLVVAEVCDIYNRDYKNLEIDITDDETVILGRKRWIFQAVSNIVSNAIKFGEGNVIEVKVEILGYSVVLTVRDYGIGIDQKNINKIFNYKYRISEMQKDGYGIGLNLVNHVCDLCGGFAYADGLEDGAKIYLSFPLLDM